MLDSTWRAYVEDDLSKAVLVKIARFADVDFADGFPVVTGGFGKIKANAKKYLCAAKQGVRTMILTDLDQKNCVPELIRDWLEISPKKEIVFPEIFLFRVAVREIESWVMADRGAFAKYMGIAAANFSLQPEQLPDPKQYLLNITRNKGRKKWHKEMLPMSEIAAIGPRYNEKMCEFVEKHWEPVRAAECSESLQRAINVLKNLGKK